MNPYEVLGIPENADEATIKHAYRELVKKYHPDKYVNNPLADLAAEKLKEINKAYDMITNKSGANTTTGTGYANNTSYSKNNDKGTSFFTVRSLISSGLYTQAQAMLDALPQNAEWYFLYGVCRIRTGWYSSGIEFIRKATQMDPSNTEYRDMLNSISNSNFAFKHVNTSSNSGCLTSCCGDDSSCCNTCTTLICIDTCCECMGSDFIPCI